MSNELITLLGLTLAAGLAMPLGALIAQLEHLHSAWLEEEFRHSVIAFGGGSLLSAVALVLVPEGIAHASVISAPLWLMLGGGLFMWLDRFLAKHQTPASQLAAMMTDFIPESIALGAAFALNSESGLLLAALIFMQNLPEGFNAFRELNANASFRPAKVIVCFAAMALLGPMAGAVGYFWLAEHVAVVSAIMLVASGGILYSIFQDIAPQVVLERHWGPPMGAVLGFNLGLVGFMLTHAS